MPKTAFIDGNPAQGIVGTVVNAAFLNKIFNHRHDGLDQDGSAPMNYAADTGAVNAFVIAMAPALIAHIPGLLISFKAANANTGASTLTINGMVAMAIKRPDGTNLVADDITPGQMVAVAYDGAAYQMISTPSSISPDNATTETAGLVELATSAEAKAGTDTSRSITPITMRSGFNASGSAPVYACRAWASFNGYSMTINASGNVSSITDAGAGICALNMTTAMPDANYAAALTSGNTDGGNGVSGTFAELSYSSVRTASSFTIGTVHHSGTMQEPTLIMAAVFR